ncbi:MAG: universal stress protein [Haloarculaceae archaeon]
MYEVILPVGAEKVDGAVAQAEAIADLPGEPEEIHVTITHTFVDNPSGASISQIQPARRASERLEDAGIAVDLDERSGNPTEEILDLAAETDADLVCIGGRKRTPTGKALFGSVTQSVLLEATCPVMVCHPEPAED